MVYAVIMDIYTRLPAQGTIRLVNMGEIKQPENYHGDGPYLRDFTYWPSLEEARKNFEQLRGQSRHWGPGVEYIDET
jgi:hypothetical protein